MQHTLLQFATFLEVAGIVLIVCVIAAVVLNHVFFLIRGRKDK